MISPADVAAKVRQFLASRARDIGVKYSILNSYFMSFMNDDAR
ncbi:hypothetical protein IGB42_03946 [Andreprevotia sp. IGB-42]|nr:hypothetical protein IGB42_03946 [Andreprevotia sp. IGB-42]